MFIFICIILIIFTLCGSSIVEVIQEEKAYRKLENSINNFAKTIIEGMSDIKNTIKNIEDEDKTSS